MKVVLDTNVLVAALLSPYGSPAQVLQLVLAGKVTLCFDLRMLTEYRDVLTRPQFGFAPHAVDDLLEYFQQTAQLVAPTPWGIDLPDPDDAAFLEAARAGHADFLVAGNLKHYPTRKRRHITVLTPTQLLKHPQIKSL